MDVSLPEPAVLPAVLNAEGVARLLGRRTAAAFHTVRPRLEQHGFPAKLPGINGWSRAAILRWVETNGETYLPADLVDDDAGAIDAARSRLEGEYA